MKILYKTETGISIIHPTGDIPINEVLEKFIPGEYKSTARIVEDSMIPSDRTFRDAWEFNGSAILENVDKAKEIHKKRLRLYREPLLQNLDVMYIRAHESGLDTTEILTEKQRLRDITKHVDKCITIDEIKLITTDYLKLY